MTLADRLPPLPVKFIVALVYVVGGIFAGDMWAIYLVGLALGVTGTIAYLSVGTDVLDDVDDEQLRRWIEGAHRAHAPLPSVDGNTFEDIAIHDASSIDILGGLVLTGARDNVFERITIDGKHARVFDGLVFRDSWGTGYVPIDDCTEPECEAGVPVLNAIDREIRRKAGYE